MYMSKIILENYVVEELMQTISVYSEHKLIWKFFPDTKERKFLYSRADSKIPEYLVVSEKKPTSLKNWKITTKEYNPNIKEGNSYRFKVICNLVEHDDNKKRHDAIYHHYLRTNRRNKEESKIRGTAIWFEDRKDALGFSLESFQVNSYTKSSFPIGDLNVQFYSCELTGLLKVTNVEHFKRSLFKGVGKARGFGRGLLLIA